jgi:hypothetical protein
MATCIDTFSKAKKNTKKHYLIFYWFKHYSLFHYISIGITYLQVFNNNVNYSNVHTQLLLSGKFSNLQWLFLKTVCWRRTSTVSWELLIFCWAGKFIQLRQQKSRPSAITATYWTCCKNGNGKMTKQSTSIGRDYLQIHKTTMRMTSLMIQI